MDQLWKCVAVLGAVLLAVLTASEAQGHQQGVEPRAAVPGSEDPPSGGSDARDGRTGRYWRPDDETHEEFRRARANFGLDASLDVTRTLAADTDALERGAMVGFPMSPQEEADLADRLLAERDAATAQEVARERWPREYASGWFDVETGTHTVAFTTIPTDADRKMAQAVEYPDRVRVVEVEYSLEQLRAAQSTYLEMQGAPGSGLPDGGSYVDHRANVLVIGSQDTPETVAAVLGVPADMIRTETEPGTDEDPELSAVYGGDRISTASEACSQGAWGAEFLAYHLVTAAHCDDAVMRHHYGGTVGGVRHAPDFEIGQQFNVDHVDVEQRFQNGQTPTYRVSGWGAGTFSLEAEATLGGPHDSIGSIVCHAGNVTQGVANCSDIIDTSATCREHIDMRLVDDSYATHGDSGGTTYGFVYGSHDVPLVGFTEGFFDSGTNPDLCPGDGVMYTWTMHARFYLGIAHWYLK